MEAMKRLLEIVEQTVVVLANWLGAVVSGIGIIGLIIWLSGQEPPGGVSEFGFMAGGGLLLWALSVYWLWRGPARLVIRVLGDVPTLEDLKQIVRVLEERKEGRCCGERHPDQARGAAVR